MDAWVDKWEMLPGDKLVDKIFEEGIKNAQAVIVVLSAHSINKPWVREELDASVVKRINQGSKLIPIVLDLDDDQMPEVLKATLWVRIPNLDCYDAQFNQIVAAIFGQHDKPTLGIPPAYATANVTVLAGLTKLDSQIMKLACEKAIELGYPYIDTETILPELEVLGIQLGDFFDTLEILDNRAYIEVMRVIGGPIPHFSITVYGFDEYARAHVPDYNAIYQSIVSEIVNKNRMDSLSIATSLNKPHMIVTHMLAVLERQGLLRIVREAGSISLHFYNVSPELKRLLRAPSI